MSFDDKEHPPGKGAISYGSYLRVPDLIALQDLVSDPGHHDEEERLSAASDAWNEFLNQLNATVERHEALGRVRAADFVPTFAIGVAVDVVSGFRLRMKLRRTTVALAEVVSRTTHNDLHRNFTAGRAGGSQAG